MPNRILKESICSSDTIQELSPEEEVMWYRLIVNCDDYGRMDARPAILRARLFPLKLDRISEADVSRWLQHLAKVALVHLYWVNGHPYLQAVTWERHQQIRAKRSKYPDPADADEEPPESAYEPPPLQSSDIRCNQVIAHVPVIQSNPIQSESNPNPIHVGADAPIETDPPEKQARHRATTVNDAIVDGLCAILGTPQSDTTWRNYRKVAGQLRRATPPVEPSEMPYIGQQWDRVFKGMTPSEDAIVKWLHRLRPNGNGKSPPLSLVPEKYCPLCGELPDETHCHCDLGELRKAKDASIAAGREDYAVTMGELLAIRRAGNLFEWLALQPTEAR